MKNFEFAKVAAIATGSFLAGAAEAQVGQPPQQVQTKVTNTKIETHGDQNMPKGFKRDQIRAQIEGQEKVVASLFYFDQDSTNARLLTNKQNPDIFNPKLDYDNAIDEVNKDGHRFAIAFAGAYKSPGGTIEGMAIQNGVSVGEQNYSKWSGFVYIDASGKVSLHRTKDTTEKFDKQAADLLVTKATNEKGCLFQQIPAIWNGEIKLNSTNPTQYEFRALVQTKTGKICVINASEKMTLAEFLKMAQELKDEQGNLLVSNLMMVDTGIYSYGKFADKDGRLYNMIDENYNTVDLNGKPVTPKDGYTNLMTISSNYK